MAIPGTTISGIRAFGFVRKAHIVRSAKHLRNLLRQYVDETSKVGYLTPAEAMGLFGEHGYLDAILSKEAPLRPGVDYIPTTGSPVRVFGQLRRNLDRRYKEIGDLSLPDLMEAARAAWIAELGDRRKKKGYHFIFSLHPAIADELARRGIPVDDVLFSHTHQALEVFAARFYPGQDISWVGGIHHDRPNPHLHAVIFPYSSGGQALNMSRLAPAVAPDGQNIRIDFQGALVGAFFDQCKETAKRLTELAPRDANLDASRVLHSFAATLVSTTKTKGRKPTAAEWREAHDEASTMSPDELAKLKRQMPAAMSSNPSEILSRRKAMNADFLADLASRRNELRKAFSGAIQARSEIPPALHLCGRLGSTVGYPAATKPAHDFTALTRETKIRTDAYRAAVGSLPDKRKGEKWLPDMVARAEQNVASAAGTAAIARDRLPSFLRPAERAPRFLSAQELEHQFRERFAAALQRNRYQLRPFTVAELANRDLSPYASSRAPEPAEMEGEVGEDPVPTNFIFDHNGRMRALLATQTPAPDIQLRPSQ